MNSRQIYVWLLSFLLLMLVLSTGCHRSQNGSAAVRPPLPPTGSEGAQTAGDAATSNSGTDFRGTINGGGFMGEGGTKAVTHPPSIDVLDRKSGGGPGAKAKPPEHEQQPPAQVINADTGNSAQKYTRKAHETFVSETVAPDPDQVLQNAVDSLPLGKVLFNHPTEMKMGEAREVQVRISRDVAADLSTGLTPSGTAEKDQITEQQQIKVSTSMKVQVHGEPYFDVKPLTDEEQLIDRTGFTEWKFTVIPLQGGKWPLHLTVTAVVHAADREKVKNLEVLDEQVTVQVSTLEVVESFIGNNWQWLIGTICIPIGAWLLPKLRKKKRAGSRRLRYWGG